MQDTPAKRPSAAPLRMCDDARLPNLIVAGVQKCGTTALHYYLQQHPHISMSRPKELNYFIAERNWSRGLAWYASHFDASAPVRGESSPNYASLRRHPGVVDRMKRVLPDVRLVFMVRDPIERLISQWIHMVADGREERALTEVLHDDGYVERSLYATQLGPFFEAFPRNHILVLEMDELRHRRAETLRRVFEFLGVEPAFWSERFQREQHRSSQKRRRSRTGRRLAATPLGRWADGLSEPYRRYVVRLLYWPFSHPFVRPVLPAEAGAELASRLRADAERFRTMMGRSFEHWSV